MIKLNLGCGKYTLQDFQNLDKNIGWSFEDGLAYPDCSVDAITISHALMYVHLRDWTDVFNDFYRVLRKEGVIRITEDDTENPDSERYQGHFDAVTMTSPAILRKALEDAGFIAYDVDNQTTKYSDKSLMQELHGIAPKVFFIEGVKA